MEQACSKHSRHCKIFFANMSVFPTFFSQSSKRINIPGGLLQETDIPRAAATQWNFNNRTVSCVYENRHALKKFFKSIIEGDDEAEVDDGATQFEWDGTTIPEACGLLKWLDDEEFLFFLKFFHIIMPEVDLLYSTLQSRNASVDMVNNQLSNFISSVERAREKINTISVTEEDESTPSYEPKQRRTDEPVTAACKEACDTILVQAKDRFGTYGHIDALQQVDPRKFKTFVKQFPTEKLQLVSQFYVIISVDQLRTELTLLYNRTEFRNAKTSLDLYQFILQNNLADTVFTEVSRVLEIALTTPLVSVESERCFSTLNRRKSFLRNTMTNDRLNALACLSMQKDMIRERSAFNQLVIDKFATSKKRQAEFLYKSYDRVDHDVDLN